MAGAVAWAVVGGVVEVAGAGQGLCTGCGRLCSGLWQEWGQGPGGPAPPESGRESRDSNQEPGALRRAAGAWPCTAHYPMDT